MAQHFRNAAPQNVALGIDDQSIRQPLPEPEALPSHLPKFYIYSEWGPEEPQLVVGNSLVVTYGLKSFDEKSPYFTHASVFLKEVNATGNAVMVERIRPANAGPNASFRLYLDVLETQVPVYERSPVDGAIVYDDQGHPIETGDTVAGFKAMWVTEEVEVDANGVDTFGAGATKPGHMTDPDNQTQSIMYPIIDGRVPHFGARGNNQGFRIFAPTVRSTQPLNEALLHDARAYPYRFQCLTREDAQSLGRPVATVTANQYVDATLLKDVVDRRTDRFVGLENIFIDSYQLLNDPIYPDLYGPFGQIHVYQDNLDTLVTQFHAAETPFIDAFSDFSDDPEDRHMFNLVSGVSSQGVPYTSFVLQNNRPEATVLTENSVIYARGGSDGDMDEDSFAESVAERIQEYGNPLSPLMDTAKYPESIFYDSGFPLETKKKLFAFISQRKDTFVVLSTHDVMGVDLNAEEESSIAQTLKTMGQLYPESEFFGTPVARAMVVGRCGVYQNSKYPKKLPLSLEIAVKAARYMGASNGIWNPNYRFSNAPGSVVDLFTDINITFTPAQVRNRDWDAGLVWVQSYQRKSVFFPAFKTIYENDTSILNSFITAMACVELQKIGDRAWRQWSGVDYLTPEQLIERNNRFIREAVAGRFDDRFIIEPETYITASDEANGFSWHHKIKIYGPNMMTVGVFTVEAHRITDYEESAGA